MPRTRGPGRNCGKEWGGSSVEYAILVSLLVAVIAMAVFLLGQRADDLYDSVVARL